MLLEDLMECFKTTMGLDKVDSDNLLPLLEAKRTRGCFGDAIFQVTQSPQHKIVRVGGNITFACAFPPFPDNSEVNVFWWRFDKSIYLQRGSDKRKQYFIRKGQGSLQILDIRFQDAGVYYCGVIQQGNTIINGTGSTLVVHAVPANPTIVFKSPGGNSNNYPILVCETVDFYPNTITFNWYKNTSNVVTGIKTTKQLNPAGLYEAISYLQETQPVQIATYYSCLISHPMLQTPKLAFYVVSHSKPETIQDGSHNCEELKKERTDDKKLTYAALNMTGSKNRGMHKQKGKSTEYAAIRLERHGRESRIAYRE
uniref:natural cytotoxicity triggering receptor 3 ligand 1-like n=1 Tax=Pristiophorus japonicus TaxID=55135 RepID=UPI00398F7CEA